MRLIVPGESTRMNEDILIAQKTEKFFEDFVNETKYEVVPGDLAAKFVQESFTFEESTRDLLAVEIKDNAATHLIEVNLLSAAGFVASVIGGIAGAANPVLLVCAILSSIASLSSLFDEASHAEGLLFWILYKRDQHTGKRVELQTKFSDMSTSIPEVGPGDFHSALSGLLDMGVIRQRGSSLEIAEKLVYIWFSD